MFGTFLQWSCVSSALYISCVQFALGGSGKLLKIVGEHQNNMERKSKALVTLMFLDEMEDDLDNLPIIVYFNKKNYHCSKQHGEKE
jgi:hypothetical protein